MGEQKLKISELESSVTGDFDRIEKLATDNAELEVENETINAELLSFKNQFEEQRNILNDLSVKYDALEMDNGEKSAEIAELNVRITELDSAGTAIQTMLDEAKNENNDLLDK